MLPSGNAVELFRDMTIEVDVEKDYFFSYFNRGILKGDVPQAIKLNITSLMFGLHQDVASY